MGEISSPLSRNLYLYTENNPVNYSDPSGHAPIPAWGGKLQMPPVKNPLLEKKALAPLKPQVKPVGLQNTLNELYSMGARNLPGSLQSAVAVEKKINEAYNYTAPYTLNHRRELLAEAKQLSTKNVWTTAAYQRAMELRREACKPVTPKASSEPPEQVFGALQLSRWLSHTIGSNPLLKQIAQNKGQNELIKSVYSTLGFEQDKDTGIYHTRPDVWQQFFGYNPAYDAAFHAGTSMDVKKFEFSVDGREYVFWAWKGDYLDLGAGLEMGIYSKESGLSLNFGNHQFYTDATSPIDEHWLTDTNLAMPMTINLQYKGETIIDYDPQKDKEHPCDGVWWATGFNPYYTDVNASDLTASFTLDFTGKQEMFDAFYDENHDKPGWIFDRVSLYATFTF